MTAQTTGPGQSRVQSGAKRLLGWIRGEDDLLRSTNTELDRVFRASPPGKVPDGELRGTVLLFPGSRFARAIAKIAYLVAWQGKRMDPDRRGLVNRITPFRLPLIRAKVYDGASWVDDEPCVVLDYSKTSFVARMVRDEIRLVAPDLYLGVVWMWRRRAAWFSLRATPRS